MFDRSELGLWFCRFLLQSASRQPKFGGHERFVLRRTQGKFFVSFLMNQKTIAEQSKIARINRWLLLDAGLSWRLHKKREADAKFGAKPSKREARAGRRARKQDMREFWRVKFQYNPEVL